MFFRRLSLPLLATAALSLPVSLMAQGATPEFTPESTPEVAFPLTVEHQYGETVIPEAPQRIVSIGYTEQDALLALGIMPVGARYWYGDEADVIFPWADDEAEVILEADRDVDPDAELPVIFNMPFGSLNYEAILALEPDLISAVTAGITQEEYDLLSAIAPTISQSDEYINFGMPWQEVTQIIGDAVGRPTQAAAFVANVEAAFAEAREAHPEFEGKTIAVVYSYGGETFGFYTPQDARARFFTELGFVVPEELIEVAGDQFYADLSAERLDLLDQEVIVIVNLQFVEGGQEAIEADPLFSQLAAVQEGRVVYLDATTENALGFSSPLSLPFALENVVPALAAVVGEE